jgi:hypothetical protein
MRNKIGSIKRMIVHSVGNKEREEGVSFSKKELDFKEIQGDVEGLLEKSFNSSDLYKFFFEHDLNLNPIYSFVKALFAEPERFVEQSNLIAKILYEKSNRPSVMKGELNVIYLTDCELDGQQVDALALLKMEQKERMVRYERDENGIKVVTVEGVNLSKVDKGCLIYNTDEADGYKISIVNKTTKNQDKAYWQDDFLHVRSCQSAYHQTMNLIGLCKDFVKQEMGDCDKMQRSLAVARAMTVINTQEEVDLNDFAEEVFQNATLADRFMDYRESSDYARELPSDTLKIEKKIPKKKIAMPSNMIHLDGNFDIIVKGGEENILKGVDSRNGMKYYQLFFEKEN